MSMALCGSEIALSRRISFDSPHLSTNQSFSGRYFVNSFFFNGFRKDENSEIQPLDATLNGGIENTVPILPLFNLSCSCAVVVPNAPREDQETKCNIRRRKERCVTGKRCACKSSGSQRQSPRKQSKRYRCY